MGDEVSRMVPPADPGQPFFALLFVPPDRIEIVLADKQTVDIVRKACFNHWRQGFQKDQYYEDGSYHLKFVGNPFSRTGYCAEEYVAAKMVATGILTDLYRAGWDFVLSSDLTRREDWSTWFFQRVTVSPRQITPSTIFCLSLAPPDALKLIGADRSVSEITRSAVQQSYGLGIQEEKITPGCHKIKLFGNPWRTEDRDGGVHARRMLLEIIRQFHRNHYRLYATGDLSEKVDCLFFFHQPQADTTPERFLMISLDFTDRLRLIECPTDVVDTTRRTILSCWRRGLQKESNLESKILGLRRIYADLANWEFKMSGNPWWADGADAVSSRSFLTNLFSALLQRGWCLASALDLSCRDNDKGVFLFRSCPPSRLPHFCLNLNWTDRIGVIDAPADVVRVIRRVIASSWPAGVKRECDEYGSLEFKLNGNPWAPDGYNESCLARSMMTKLLANLAIHGWRVIASADVSAKYVHRDNAADYPIDVDSWFVVYTGIGLAPPVSPGAPPLGSDFDSAPPSYDQAIQ